MDPACACATKITPTVECSAVCAAGNRVDLQSNYLTEEKPAEDLCLETSDSCRDWLLFSLLEGENNGSPEGKMEGVRDDTDGEGTVVREELR